MKIILSLLTAAMIVLQFGSMVSAHGNGADRLYSDVSPYHWAYQAIDFATGKKWFSGYPDGTFGPNYTISRAEAMKVLVSMFGREANEVSDTGFADVNDTDWYAPYIAAGKDLLPGAEEGGRFLPNLPITREDTVYALISGMKLNISVEYVDSSILEAYHDANEINVELKPYFAMAIQKKLIAGYIDGTVKAKNPLTRAEFAILLYRAYEIKYGKAMEQTEATNDEADRPEQDFAESETVEFDGYGREFGGYEEDFDKSDDKKSDETEFRKTVVTLVNAIRNDHGLKLLSENPELAQAAQMKAEDMQDNGYFDHHSPTYGSPFDMMEQFGISYRYAGENIAKGQSTPQEVVNSWMNSEGHKRNILNSSYTQIGIGYSADGNIWVQMFIGP